MVKKCIIIGSGILGASTAYHLAKKGVNVIVIDRNDQGQATDAAAGIVCPWLSQRRNKAWYNLAKNGARMYHKLINELQKDGEEDVGYAQIGAISLHTDEKSFLQCVIEHLNAGRPPLKLVKLPYLIRNRLHQCSL